MFKLGFRKLKLYVVSSSLKPSVHKNFSLDLNINNYRTISSSSVWSAGKTRFYFVTRADVQVFKLPRYTRWFKGRCMLIFAALVTLRFARFIDRTVDTLPYTKRKQFVLVSRRTEIRSGELDFRYIKNEELPGKMLPVEHPKSVKVRLITEYIINGLYRSLNVPSYVKEDEVAKDLHVHEFTKKGSIDIEGMKWGSTRSR